MMKVSSALTFLLSYTSISTSAAAGPNYLRGIIDDNGNSLATSSTNDNANNNAASAYVQLPCSQLTDPVDYDECRQLNVPGCQDEHNRAVKQCYAVKTAGVNPWYVCSPASQCEHTATTTKSSTASRPVETPEPANNTRKQVGNEKCMEYTGAYCKNDDKCFDHYFNKQHIIYCDRVHEEAKSQCVHHNKECNPSPPDGVNQCCGQMTCASVEENIPQPFRQDFGGIEYACLVIVTPSPLPASPGGQDRDVDSGPKCAHQYGECNPDATEGLKKCCGTLSCLSVAENVPEKHRVVLPPGTEFACLARRESDAEGDFLVEE